MFVLPLVVVSCGDWFSDPTTGPGEYDGDYGFYQELTVPIGTSVIYVENNGKTIEIPVSPALVKPDNGKEIEPFGVIALNLVSPVKTAFNAYYMINRRRVELIENGLVINEVASTKADAPVRLTEPAPYENGDPGYTIYHSSGVVMFEDSWPVSDFGNQQTTPPYDDRGKYDTDFNDLVLDYDIEAVTVDDALYASQGWREQVKVVLHVRATSASKAIGCDTEIKTAGLILEGFNMDYVADNEEGGKWIETYCSMDSWQNPHAPSVDGYDFGLPGWAKEKLAKNSKYNINTPLKPYVEIGGINSLKDPESGAGSEVYTRRNDNTTTEDHVFNPALKQYNAWMEPKTEQYDAALADLYDNFGYATLEKTQGTGYYNVVPGYVNVNGGLYTYTVIYHMKDRSEMSAAEKAAMLKNMKDALYDTFKQNFYVVTTEDYPIGLQGYTPYDKAKYDEVVAANSDKLASYVTYKSSDPEGYIWAFKCPTLTRHMWNKLPFSAAYPLYSNWIKTNGAEDADWYEKEIDSRYMVCWW